MGIATNDLNIIIDDLDSEINTAIENGLIINDIEFKTIQDRITEARNFLASSEKNISIEDKAVEGQKSLNKAEEAINYAGMYYYSAIRKAPLRWRFSTIYGGEIWFYLIGFMTIIFFLYYYDLIDLLTSAIEVPRIAVDATIWGVLGGILRGIWKLWTNVDQRGFRIIWRIYFFSCPFLGGLLGALLYLLIVSGLFLISQTNQTEINDVLSAQMVIMALSAVAGYNWEWAIRIFDRIGNLSE